MLVHHVTSIIHPTSVSSLVAVLETKKKCYQWYPLFRSFMKIQEKAKSFISGCYHEVLTFLISLVNFCSRFLCTLISGRKPRKYNKLYRCAKSTICCAFFLKSGVYPFIPKCIYIFFKLRNQVETGYFADVSKKDLHVHI